MSYSPIQLFSNQDPADLARLNQIIQNQQWLKDNAVSYKYDAYGTVQNDGVKIACGVVPIGGTTSRIASRNISFGSFFTPGSKPVVVGTLASLNRRQSWVSVQNRSGNSVIPDSAGVKLTSVFVSNDTYAGDHRINWVAIGY